MNIHSSLVSELRDKAYRDAYVASQIKIGLPFQARALRRAKGWTQEQLADVAGMTQPRIAEIEKPGKRRFNLETLLRIASAFDVGLEVRFVPVGVIVDHNEQFDPDTFDVQSFNEELIEADRKEEALTLARAAFDKFISVAQLNASAPTPVPAPNASLLRPAISKAEHQPSGVFGPQRAAQLKLPLMHLVSHSGAGAADPAHKKIVDAVSPAA